MKKLVFLLALSCIFGLQVLRTQDYPFEVNVYGSGDPVFLVPGFSCPGEVWDTTVEALKDNYELHVFTLAGFGEEPPVGFPWLPKIKEGMKEYIANNKLKKVSFVGHSMGGTLGLWLASENPEIFSLVVSVDGLPAMGALMFPDYNAENFSYESQYNKQMLSMNEEAFTVMANQMAGGMTLTENKKPILVEWMKQADSETYVYGYTDLLKLDLREELANIESPVVIFAATQPYGKDLVKTNIQKQFESLKEYELVMAENAAHFIMFDRPDWFNATLKEYLNRK